MEKYSDLHNKPPYVCNLYFLSKVNIVHSKCYIGNNILQANINACVIPQ